MKKEQLEHFRDAPTHHHTCLCGKCFSEQANFRAVVRALATECLTLKDYVDTLEAVVHKVASLDQITWSAPVSNSILRDFRNDAREALDKGK